MLVTDAGVWEAGWSAEAAATPPGRGPRGHALDWAHARTPRTARSPRGPTCTASRDVTCSSRWVVAAVSTPPRASPSSCRTAATSSTTRASTRLREPIPPLVAAPTTAGTGADLSQFAIISDVARHVKVTLLGRALVPDISITDPRTLTTMPDWLAATTGLDALTHGIESYVSRAASFLTDGHALAAIELVREHLPHSLEQPTSVAAQMGMARASMSAGLAFTNAILGRDARDLASGRWRARPSARHAQRTSSAARHSLQRRRVPGQVPTHRADAERRGRRSYAAGRGGRGHRRQGDRAFVIPRRAAAAARP